MSTHSEQQAMNESPEQTVRCGAPRLSVVLPHTDLALTEVAMREAVRMARGLDARVIVLAARIVPFPASLDPALGYPGLSQLVALAETTGVAVGIQIVYARDWESACEYTLEAGSVVVMAVHRGWRRTREARLAGWLTRAGHKVTTVPV